MSHSIITSVDTHCKLVIKLEYALKSISIVHRHMNVETTTIVIDKNKNNY